ncbi:MAG: phosphotransferase family protein [Sphingorhabdus sp.]|nr:phosphotransferase family protein [Sphingorhabdus sp.]
MAIDGLSAQLNAAMQRMTSVVGDVTMLNRLSGGATMESWAFEFAARPYVLRRAPSPEMMAGRPLTHANEAALVMAAHDAGVRAPHVTGVLLPTDGMGSGYIMQRVGGTADPAAIFAQASTGLIDQIAGELAKIHGLTPQNAGAAISGVPSLDVADALAEFKTRFAEYGGDRPIIALAIRWCETHIPAAASPVLVHGDFRMGNLMADEDGLTAVLDWELAHWGDRHDDLAYGCLNVWRFGRLDLPAYGLASFDEFFAAYEAASNVTVDPERFRFWFIFRTLWWALGCLQMTAYWRSGADRNLERAVIGRRTSENELDLLMMLEQDAPIDEQSPALPAAAQDIRRVGEASAHEMLDAVREWISSDVKAQAQGRGKFMAAVAMNALAMVQRELASPAQIYDKPLCDDILSGAQNLGTPGLLARLRGGAIAKLSNDVPKYAGLAAAQAKWSQ